MPLPNPQLSRERTTSVLACYLDIVRGQEDKLEELGLRYDAGVNPLGSTSKGEQIDFIFRKKVPRETLQELATELLENFTTINRIDITP